MLRTKDLIEIKTLINWHFVCKETGISYDKLMRKMHKNIELDVIESELINNFLNIFRSLK